jgi:hypothetical protein
LETSGFQLIFFLGLCFFGTSLICKTKSL